MYRWNKIRKSIHNDEFIPVNLMGSQYQHVFDMIKYIPVDHPHFIL